MRLLFSPVQELAKLDLGLSDFKISLIWSLGTLMTAMADGFAVLFTARMLAGLGAFCALTVAISMLADLTPAERREERWWCCRSSWPSSCDAADTPNTLEGRATFPRKRILTAIPD